MQYKEKEKGGFVKRIALKSFLNTGLYIGGVIALGVTVPYKYLRKLHKNLNN